MIQANILSVTAQTEHGSLKIDCDGLGAYLIAETKEQFGKPDILDVRLYGLADIFKKYGIDSDFSLLEIDDGIQSFVFQDGRWSILS